MLQFDDLHAPHFCFVFIFVCYGVFFYLEEKSNIFLCLTFFHLC